MAGGAKRNRFYKSDEVTYDPSTDTVLHTWGSDGSIHEYELDDLSGGELRTLCAIVFDHLNVADATAEARKAALRKGDATLLGGTEGEAPEPTPKAKSTPKGDDPKAAALAALNDLLSPSIDMDEVRKMVEVEVAEVTSKMRPTVVKVGEAPEVKMKGRPHKDLVRVTTLVAAGVAPYLVGPAGTGKSTLAKQVAEAMGISFGELPTDPTMSTTKLFGYMDAMGNYVGTEFRTTYAEGGVFLLDEIDNGHPSVVKGVNNALASSAAAFPDGRVERHEQFRFIAAANTFGLGANRQYVGASQLDASTLDRFFTVEVDYDEDLEHDIAKAIAGSKGTAWANHVHRIRANQRSNDLRVVVSTRAVEQGCRAIQAGMSEQAAYEGTIGAAHDRSTNEKLLAGVRLGS